jgi:hypothetical protein
MVAKTINSKVEEENLIGPEDKEECEGPETTHPINTTIDSNKEEEKPMTPRSIMDKEVEELVTPRSIMDEEVEKLTTPRSKMGSNNVNNTLRKIGSAYSI